LARGEFSLLSSTSFHYLTTTTTLASKGNFLLTAEDFRFFLEEHQLESLIDDIDLDVRFVVVQFVEIGGDHLDSLMKLDLEREKQEKEKEKEKTSLAAEGHPDGGDDSNNEFSPWLVGILDRTTQLLKVR